MAEEDFEDERDEQERTSKKSAVVKPPQTWAELREQFVYVGQQKRFVRISDGRMWEVDAFQKHFGHIAKRMRLKVIEDGVRKRSAAEDVIDELHF